MLSEIQLKIDFLETEVERDGGYFIFHFGDIGHCDKPWHAAISRKETQKDIALQITKTGIKKVPVQVEIDKTIEGHGNTLEEAIDDLIKEIKKHD